MGLYDLQLVLVHFPVSSRDPDVSFLCVVVVYTTWLGLGVGLDEVYILIGRLSFKFKPVSSVRDIAELLQRFDDGISSIVPECNEVDVAVDVVF